MTRAGVGVWQRCVYFAVCFAIALGAFVAPAQAAVERESLPIEPAWDLPLPQPVMRGWIASQVPELVFFQLAGTYEIHCVEAKSGFTRWVSEPLAGPIQGDPFVHRQVLPGQREREVIIDDRLYVIIQDTLHCFDVGSGQRIWRLELPFSASTGPVFVGPTEGSARGYIGDWTGRIQVVGIHQPLHEQQRKFPYIAWQRPLPGIVRAAVVDREQKAYVGDTSGRVRCYRLDPSLVWESDAGGAVEGGVTVRDRVVYAGTAANALVAFDALSGERLGQLYLSGPVRRRPFWFPDDGDRLYAWVGDERTGSSSLVAIISRPDQVPRSDPSKFAIQVQRMGQVWQVNEVDAVVGSTPLHLYLAHRRTRSIVQVHRGTGKVERRFSAELLVPAGDIQGMVSYQHGFALHIPVIAYSRQGWVRCWRAYGFIPTPEQERRSIASPASARPAPEAASPPSTATP